MEGGAGVAAGRRTDGGWQRAVGNDGAAGGKKEDLQASVGGVARYCGGRAHLVGRMNDASMSALQIYQKNRICTM